MLQEVVLIKQSIYTDKIPKKLPIDYRELKKNIIYNYENKLYKNDSDWSYLNQYYRMDEAKYSSWIRDYIRDHFNLYFKKALKIIDTAGIVQNKNEEINFTDHIDDYDLFNSPDLSSIINIDKGKSPAFIEFEYNNSRHRHLKYREFLEPGKIILFSSNLSHRFSKNLDSKKIINLSCKFQFIS